MKKFGMLLFSVYILGGCSSFPIGEHVDIEWVDFLKWKDENFYRIYNGELSNESFIGEPIGEVRFTVSDHVKNPDYKIKNGDAAYLAKGTEIFTVKGEPDILAVKSNRSTNGYLLYSPDHGKENRWTFSKLPIENVQNVEIYQGYAYERSWKIAEMKEKGELADFLQLLVDSEANPVFEPDLSKGNPLNFDIIIYTGAPVAYKYTMQFDGETYYWYPEGIEILSNEIKAFLNQE